MPRSTTLFNKGSILPEILEIETELVRELNDVKKSADTMVQSARQSGEDLTAATKKELPVFEEEERKRLLEQIRAETVGLSDVEEQDLRDIERDITRNRDRVLKYLLNEIIPGWDDRLPE